MTRHCGGCQLCCKLVPVADLGKGAGERCKHQRFGKGCLVYHRPDKGFPQCCALWNCAWLGGAEGTEDLSRPDRVHYVIDVMPDFVVAQHEGQEDIKVPVIQIWVDPAFPNAHRDPNLRAYLAQRAEREGCAALIRYNNEDAFLLAAPCLSSDGQWHEQQSNRHLRKEHSMEEIVAAVGGIKLELRP